MRRVSVEPRPNFARLIESQGLVFDRPPEDRNRYWPDNVYYSLTFEETDVLEKAAMDVFDMCCEAAEYLVAHPEVITARMAIPAYCLKQIKKSWQREPAWGSVYGRFDVCFGGLNHPDPALRVPRFYEFNADTPTSLLESSTVQRLWLEQTGHGPDQYNDLCRYIVAAWERNLRATEAAAFRGRPLPVVHFSCSRSEQWGEDVMNTTVLMELCRQAGWEAKPVWTEDILLGPDGRFYDRDLVHLDVVFKLYPWEWMVREQFGEACFKDMENIGLHNEAGEYVGGTVWFEAPYKMLWSNKALWAVLWDLFKDDPRAKYLLPTYFEDDKPDMLTDFARKPIFSRQGDDVMLQKGGETLDARNRGWYGAQGWIVQQLALPAEFTTDDGESRWTVFGMWIIDGEPAGLGIREDDRPITSDFAAFIPHTICDMPLTYEKIPIPDLAEIEEILSLKKYGTEVRAQSKESYDIMGFINRVVALTIGRQVR